MKVRVSDEVKTFLYSLAPEPRQKLKRALKNTPPQPLEGDLEGFWKIRSGKFRVLCHIEADTLTALYANYRSTVYEIATASLLEDILKQSKD
ncbi:MAG: hypothetical protein JWO95_3506 [Verrucomicrobiales bacterium]|nr:hypothetical protein [Verrucomicrobiales bacterium]